MIATISNGGPDENSIRDTGFGDSIGRRARRNVGHRRRDDRRATTRPEQVTLENWLSPAFNAWSFEHLEAILPTTTVDRGNGAVSALERDRTTSATSNSPISPARIATSAQFLEDQHIDALVLWSHGKLRQEVYRNGETARTRHLMMSVTKSFTGLVAEMLIAEGKLDETKQVTDYVPELKGSAYDGATLRNLLNMEIGIDFSEVYDDPNSTIYQFSYAAGSDRYRPA